MREPFPLEFDRGYKTDIHAALRQLVGTLCRCAKDRIEFFLLSAFQDPPGKGNRIEILNYRNLLPRHILSVGPTPRGEYSIT